MIMEEPPITSEIAAPEPDKKRKISEQDQRMQNDITEASVMIGNLEADLEIKTKLATVTINEEEIDRGKAAQLAAQDSFTERQNALGAEQTAYTALQTLWPTVIKEAGDFREIARARIPEIGLRKALGLVGNFPQDRQRVLTLLRATYTEAQKPEYQDIFGSAFSIIFLTERLERLQAAEDAIVEARNATNTAKRATEQRNEAVKSLKLWTSMVKKIARRALRDRPDLLGKLGV
jgi:hypothetical protein